MPKTKADWLKYIKRFIFVLTGSLILGIGNGLFFIPFDIVAGGISGICIIINVLSGINTALLITIINWIFFFLGWIILGHDFALKTIVSAIVYPLAVLLGTYLYNSGLRLEAGTDINVNYLLAAIFGGLFVGVGVALTFLGGGSTGGVDVITLVIQKYTGIKASIPSFLVDSSIILLGFIINPFNIILIGIISAFMSSTMIDKLFDAERNVVVNIISNKYQEINQFILEKLNRGSTIVDAVGGYSECDYKLLQVVLNYREYYILEDIVAKVDAKAFMYMTKAYSVKGEGFKAHTYRKSKKANNNEKV